MEIIKNARRNTIWGIIDNIVCTIFPFVIRTIIIKKLGADYAGLSSLFSSILSALNLTELGVSSAIIYNMYKPIAENDYKKINALMETYRKIYKKIALFIFLMGIAILPFIKNFINGKYPVDLNLYILYLIYLLNSVASYSFFAYKTALLNAYQRKDILYKISTIVRLFMFILQILVIVCLKDYYMYSGLFILSTISINLFADVYTKKNYPFIKCSGLIDDSTRLNIKERVRALVGHRISVAVIRSSDGIVISAFLGLVALTNYSNYFFVISFMVAILDILTGSFVAGIGNSFAKDEIEKLYAYFKKIQFLYSWIVGWFAICYLCLIQDFIEVWFGKEYVYESSITVLMFGIYFYTWKIRAVILRYKEAAGMWTEDFWKPYIASAVNLVTNIILVNLIQIDGVLLSTIFCMVFINLPWEVYVLYGKLFKKAKAAFYKKQVESVLFTIIIGKLTLELCDNIKETNIVSFVVKVTICILIPNIVFFAFYWKKEDLIENIKKILK